jgi:Icc protein
MLTVAQITDLHITTDKDPLNQARNAARLAVVLDAIHALRPRPVAIIASGDLVDRGEPAEYEALKAALAGVRIPIYFGLGNHDARAPMMAALEGQGAAWDDNGFVQYAVELEGGLRLVMADTLAEGADGAGFCEARAAWLARTLAAAPDTPTILALHHPPVASGIAWMDPDLDDPWIGRLRSVLEAAPQVRAVVCGHIHRAFHAPFAGKIVSAASATSIQLTLDLTPIDLVVPDGREILVEEPPGFGLLVWDAGVMTAHTCAAGPFSPAVHYTRPFISDGSVGPLA